MSDTNLSLPAPTVNEAPGGVLDPADAEGGVNVVIPAYADFCAGDQVQVYWNGDSATAPYTVREDEGDKPITLVVPEAAILTAGEGTTDFHYTITDRAGNISKPSLPVQLAITQP
ncbi:hypothetical protein [Streptomyces sp. NPDC001568]|uniref:hypothetical protein n=1 Tax=Streptomyces sp. NPDC001568 TaxID=3364588 RepID=UPI00368A007B